MLNISFGVKDLIQFQQQIMTNWPVHTTRGYARFYARLMLNAAHQKTKQKSTDKKAAVNNLVRFNFDDFLEIEFCQPFSDKTLH